MKQLSLLGTSEELTILCLGAHCDDIEIGCGGSLLKLLQSNPNVNLHWHVFTSTPARKKEATYGAELFSAGAKSFHLDIKDFPDGYLPYEGSKVKQAMEAVKSLCPEPDIVFTHYRNDMHQDHRKISELTWNSFRNHLILEYEIPKWDGDMGIPNTFVDLSEDIVKHKISHLQTAYNTQKSKRWFTDDLFSSLMRIRGMECNSESLFAEAFHSRKLKLVF